MELSVATLLQFSRMVVRDPASAMRALKAAQLSRDAGLLIMLLAGVVSGLIKGLIDLVVPTGPMELEMGNGEVMQFVQPGAIAQGLFAAVSGLALAVAIYHVGRKMGGKGSWAEILTLVAGLQMVMVVVLVVQTLVMFVSPVLAVLVLGAGLWVFFRGLGHAVNVGHDFNDMGRSLGAIVMSFAGLTVALFFVGTLLGLGSMGEMR